MKPRSIPPEVAVLCDSPLSFHRALVKPAGGALNALLLSQALYWTKRTQDTDGWFYKTRTDWSEETGMTRSEQETARAALRKSGILEEKLEGLPAKVHFRVNLQKLADLMRQDAASKLATIPPTARLEVGQQCGQNPASIYAETEITTEITSEADEDPPILNADELTFDDLDPIGRAYSGGAPGPTWCKQFQKQPQVLINLGFTVRRSDLMAAAIAGRAAHESEKGGAPRYLDYFDKALDAVVRAKAAHTATSTEPDPATIRQQREADNVRKPSRLAEAQATLAAAQAAKAAKIEKQVARYGGVLQ